VTQRDLKRVEQAASKAYQAHEELIQAILQAHKHGERLDDIGKAAALPRQQVQQIVLDPDLSQPHSRKGGSTQSYSETAGWDRHR
jgi:hypothetical protein